MRHGPTRVQSCSVCNVETKAHENIVSRGLAGGDGGFYRIRIPCILHASCMYRACRFDVSRLVVFSTKIEITFVQDDGCGPCVPAHASDATSTCIAGCSLHAFWLGDFAKRSAQNTTHERAHTAASATPDTALPHTNTATQL